MFIRIGGSMNGREANVGANRARASSIYSQPALFGRTDCLEAKRGYRTNRARKKETVRPSLVGTKRKRVLWGCHWTAERIGGRVSKTNARFMWVIESTEQCVEKLMLPFPKSTSRETFTRRYHKITLVNRDAPEPRPQNFATKSI